MHAWVSVDATHLTHQVSCCLACETFVTLQMTLALQVLLSCLSNKAHLTRRVGQGLMGSRAEADIEEQVRHLRICHTPPSPGLPECIPLHFSVC